MVVGPTSLPIAAASLSLTAYPSFRRHVYTVADRLFETASLIDGVEAQRNNRLGDRFGLLPLEGL